MKEKMTNVFWVIGLILLISLFPLLLCTLSFPRSTEYDTQYNVRYYFADNRYKITYKDEEYSIYKDYVKIIYSPQDKWQNKFTIITKMTSLFGVDITTNGNAVGGRYSFTINGSWKG